MLACSQYTPSLISSLLCCTVLLCLPCHPYHALYALCSFMEHVFSIVNSNKSTTKFTIALLDSRGVVQLATLLQFIPLPFEHLQQHVANHETFRDIAFSTKYLGRYTLMKLMKESQFINVLLTVIFCVVKEHFYPIRILCCMVVLCIPALCIVSLCVLVSESSKMDRTKDQA